MCGKHRIKYCMIREQASELCLIRLMCRQWILACSACQSQSTDHNLWNYRLNLDCKTCLCWVRRSAGFDFLCLSLDCFCIRNIQSCSKIKFPSIKDEFKSSSWSFCCVNWWTLDDSCSLRLVSTRSFSSRTLKSVSFHSNSVVDFSSSLLSFSVTSVHSEHSLGVGFDILFVEVNYSLHFVFFYVWPS